MAWIEFHDDIWEHHKTERLSDLLGLPIVYTVGHLASLWHFTLRNAWRDADLAPWGEKGIERGARWVGDPGKFVAAARECGFLDGTIVHGWMDRAGKLVQDRLYNEQRRKNVDLRRKADATVHNPTVHNPTVPTDIAPRLENPSVTPPKTFLTFRCAGTPDEWTLTEAKLAEYSLSFPGVDASREVRRAWQWTIDNPRNIKTARGMPAFLGRWLGRAQDTAGAKNGKTRIVGGASPSAGKYDGIERS